MGEVCNNSITSTFLISQQILIFLHNKSYIPSSFQKRIDALHRRSLETSSFYHVFTSFDSDLGDPLIIQENISIFTKETYIPS